MSDRMTAPNAAPSRSPNSKLPATLAGLSLGLLALVGLGAGLGGCGTKQGKGESGTQHAGAEEGAAEDGSDAQRPERVEIDVFAFGRQLGTVAPCGCTTDPLGGLQFAFGYIEAESTAGNRLVLEPGSFLFPDPAGPEGPTDAAAWGQATQRAKLLHARFSKLDGLISGFGPTDVAAPSPEGGGAGGVAMLAELPMPRVIANVSDDARPAGVETVRTLPVGHGLDAAVTAVVDPELAKAARESWAPAFPELGEPVAALNQDAIQAELGKADLQVVLVHGPRELAEAVARGVPGVDIVVMGGEFHNAERGRVGTAPAQLSTEHGEVWLLEPGDRAQSISHLTLSIAPSVAEGELPPKWTLQPSTKQRQAELDRLEAKLAKFADNPSADASFIARLEADRDALKAQLADPSVPEDVALAVIPAQTKVNCRLPEDEAAQTALHDYDGWVAEQNQKRFAGVKAPEVAKGQAHYAGIEACGDCHEEAVAQWKTTVHAGAYETLVVANKQFDLSCVGCHVTGFREPGGSEVVENEGLTSVQCEQCHGPGSLHVEDPTPDNIVREAPMTVCLTCHTEDHSDTFDYEAYLRDVLGKGHGEQRRAALGDGPTGRELRQAGLEAAGGGCPKKM